MIILYYDYSVNNMNIISLPVEIQHKILLELPLNECIINVRVCKNWYENISNSNFWKDKAKQLRLQINGNKYNKFPRKAYICVIKELSKNGVTYGSDKHKSIGLCIKRLIWLISSDEYFKNTGCYKKDIDSLIDYFLKKPMSTSELFKIISTCLICVKNNIVESLVIKLCKIHDISKINSDRVLLRFAVRYKLDNLLYDLAHRHQEESSIDNDYKEKLILKLWDQLDQKEYQPVGVMITDPDKTFCLFALAADSIQADDISTLKTIIDNSKMKNPTNKTNRLLSNIYSKAIFFQKEKIITFMEQYEPFEYELALKNSIIINNKKYINILLNKINPSNYCDSLLIESIKKCNNELIDLFSSMKIKNWDAILYYSILKNNDRMIKLCLTKNITFWNRILIASIKTRNMEIINISINKGANNWTDCLKNSLYVGDQKLIDMFLGKSPIDWDCVLHAAIIKNNKDMIKYCISKNNDISQKCIQYGMQIGNYEIVKFLVKNNHTVSKEMIEECNDIGHKDISTFLSKHI